MRQSQVSSIINGGEGNASFMMMNSLQNMFQFGKFLTEYCKIIFNNNMTRMIK